MYSDISQMTLEEQIGQVLMVGFLGITPSQEIINLIRNHHIGNIILFSRNVGSMEQVRALTNSLQTIAKEAGHRHPLLISIDQENGMVQRLGRGSTIFPGNMALGAIDSEQIAYDIALATGRESKAVGINMNLAPVVDINNNPDNPVIGVRSFGEDPYQVARLGAAMVKGYKEAGIISTLKHFPGHGDTAVDSHLALPSISYTLDRLEAVELVPFRRCIEAGADSVMTAHVYLPALMNGEMLPSTVSPEIVHDLLREKLGFAGIIISDCMEMQALSDTIGTERGTVMALRAGTDLVLISHTYTRHLSSIEAIQVALQEGTLSPQTIGQAAGRVLAYKQRMLSWDDLPNVDTPIAIDTTAHNQLRDDTYERSITLVRDQDNLLPLHLETGQRIAVIFLRLATYTLAVEKQVPEESFVASIRQRHPLVDTLSIGIESTGDEYERLQQIVKQADSVIVVTVNAHLDHHEAEVMQSLMQLGRPLIGLAVYNPYDLLAFPQLGTYLVTYESSAPALEMATRVLFGELSPQGHLPVSLPGLYEL